MRLESRKCIVCPEACLLATKDRYLLIHGRQGVTAVYKNCKLRNIINLIKRLSCRGRRGNFRKRGNVAWGWFTFGGSIATAQGKCVRYVM